MLDPLKLQKIIYFAHGQFLAEYDDNLVNEPFHAFKFGPLISSIYHEYKKFGNNPIDKYMSELTFTESTPSWKVNFIPENDNATHKLLKNTLLKYSEYTGNLLSKMTNIPDGPWHKTYSEGLKLGIKNGKEIPNKVIQQYFLTSLEFYSNTPANRNSA